MKRRVIGIGETVLDILFKNDQPQKAVPGGSTFNSIVSLGRAGVPCAIVTETGSDHVGDMICAFLKENKEYKVVVIGHTDSYGDPEQNLRYFGMQRAEALRDYMVKQGAPAEQIRCESKGQNEPVAPNDSRANRALNRRANIRFE